MGYILWMRKFVGVKWEWLRRILCANNRDTLISDANYSYSKINKLLPIEDVNFDFKNSGFDLLCYFKSKPDSI